MPLIKLQNISRQLKIDFGDEYNIKEEILYITVKDQSDFFTDDDRLFGSCTEAVCELCDSEDIVVYLPMASNGRHKITTEYSDILGYVCEECFEKNNGDEIIQKYRYKRSILDRIIKRRGITVFDNRKVLIEKISKKVSEV